MEKHDNAERHDSPKDLDMQNVCSFLYVSFRVHLLSQRNQRIPSISSWGSSVGDPA